jgi:hypothetical protein
MQSSSEWWLRDELYAASQRWYLIVLFCLAGAALGWLAAQLWPSPHRVSKELFVGLNVYQSGEDRGAVIHSGLPFLNANDYKNWQMSSLNTVIYMDAVLDDTLRRLRGLDPYWNSVERDELAGMLHAYWRNAGKWRLVAEHKTPMYATQAVLQWQDAVVEQVHTAVAESQLAMQIDLQMTATAASQAEASEQAALLAEAQAAAVDWRGRLTALPPQEPLAEAERMLLWQAVIPAGKDESWKAAEDSFPASGARAGDYLEWIDSVDPALQHELAGWNRQVRQHEQRYQELAAQYSEAVGASLGLSAELLVQKISDRKLEETEVRPIGMAMLIGAGLGFILWAAGWLVRPSLAYIGEKSTGE